MKIVLKILMLIVFVNCRGQDRSTSILWYDAPAADWNEALPLGNGRLGAMIFGIPGNENIQLNEATLWAGGPHRNDNPNAKESLDDMFKKLGDVKFKDGI